MTHSTTSLERESFGSLKAFIHVIDITSLDSAGQEDYDPSTELNVNLGTDYAVLVAGKEDQTTGISWDHLNDHLDVIDLADSTNIANNTDVGEVKLVVVGV